MKRTAAFSRPHQFVLGFAHTRPVAAALQRAFIKPDLFQPRPNLGDMDSLPVMRGAGQRNFFRPQMKGFNRSRLKKRQSLHEFQTGARTNRHSHITEAFHERALSIHDQAMDYMTAFGLAAAAVNDFKWRVFYGHGAAFLRPNSPMTFLKKPPAAVSLATVPDSFADLLSQSRTDDKGRRGV